MQTHTRRTFLRTASLGAASLAVLPLTGCTVTAAQIAADGEAVSNALLAVAKILALTNPTLAANLTTAAQALLAATQSWTTGSTLAIINSAAQAVEAVMAAIDPNSIIAPLIAVAMAALDILLANIQTLQSGPPAPAPTPQPARTVNSPYHSMGRGMIHHRLGRSPEGDFKAAWNTAAKANPALASAVLP